MSSKNQTGIDNEQAPCETGGSPTTVGSGSREYIIRVQCCCSDEGGSRGTVAPPPSGVQPVNPPDPEYQMSIRSRTGEDLVAVPIQIRNFEFTEASSYETRLDDAPALVYMPALCDTKAERYRGFAIGNPGTFGSNKKLFIYGGGSDTTSHDKISAWEVPAISGVKTTGAAGTSATLQFNFTQGAKDTYLVVMPSEFLPSSGLLEYWSQGAVVAIDGKTSVKVSFDSAADSYFAFVAHSIDPHTKPTFNPSIRSKVVEVKVA